MKKTFTFAILLLVAGISNAQNREVTVIEDLGPGVDKVALYEGPDLYTGSWANYPKVAFAAEVKAGDVINVHVTGDENTSGQCLQSLYKTDEGTVDHLCIGDNEWRCSGVPAGPSVVAYTVRSEEEAAGINVYGGWVFGGDKVTINSIYISGPGPVVLSNWSGHKYTLPTIEAGDVITLTATGLGGGMMQSYAKSADGQQTFFLGNDTGWNGIGVADGEADYPYTVNADEAALINLYGYSFGGDKVSVSKITHTPAELITGITSYENKNENHNAYNLAGQRVNNAAKGIVIINGKKYLNK